ncbi:MAG: N-6 DNA methylase, partial [Ruminococcus sp.]|nr:N-6 DNA methylase [Ruminococcus sp.]
PRDMFYTVDLSCTLWIVNMNKKAGKVNGRAVRDRSGEVLFMDLRQWNDNTDEISFIAAGKTSKKKKTVLTDNQIAQIKKTYNNWQSADTSLYSDIPEYCKSATIEDIRANDYSLAPSKYIEFIDHDLEIDYEAEMARIQVEMRDIISAEKKSQTMLEAAFRGIGYGID